MTAFLFYLFSGLLLGSAIYVVLNRSPMYSVVALVFSFMNLAALYFLLEAYFIGVLQVLIYAGAIMVLFLFVVMLLNVKTEKTVKGLVIPAPWWYGLLALVFLILVFGLVGSQGVEPESAAEAAGTGFGAVSAVGEALFTRYLLPFEIASLLLTVALIGTVFLAKRKI